MRLLDPKTQLTRQPVASAVSRRERVPRPPTLPRTLGLGGYLDGCGLSAASHQLNPWKTGIYFAPRVGRSESLKMGLGGGRTPGMLHTSLAGVSQCLACLSGGV